MSRTRTAAGSSQRGPSTRACGRARVIPPTPRTAVSTGHRASGLTTFALLPEATGGMIMRGMGKKDPRVDAYVAKSAPFARPILRRLRTLVHRGCPEVVEEI